MAESHSEWQSCEVTAASLMGEGGAILPFNHSSRDDLLPGCRAVHQGEPA